jgi:uncharacterized membrane protein
MTIAVWIASGLLALAYLTAGVMKAFLPAERIAKNFPWTETVGLPATRVIGVLEILGAIGLILPPLTGIAPIVAGFAAVGLVLVQVGAIATHIRRHERFIVNIALLLLAAFVAVGRFLGY